MASFQDDDSIYYQVQLFISPYSLAYASVLNGSKQKKQSKGKAFECLEFLP